MTQDDIRKLLGGYAAGALSADERQTLFQAALDDQELFNALANEDALKELLDDPVTRAQLRAAMQPPRREFQMRRWIYGVALPAAIAIVVIAVMNRAGAPRLIDTKPAETARVTSPPVPAMARPVPAPAPPQEQKHGQAAVRRVFKASPMMALRAPAPSTQIEHPALVAPALAAMRSVASPIPDAVRRQFAAGFDANAPVYQGPLVRYSLLRTGPDGHAVRVQVTTGVAGYLALYEVADSGSTTRVYPAGDLAARVMPNLPIQIPSRPIEVPAAGAKLRLVLVPAPMPAITGFVGGADTTIGTGNAPLADAVPSTPLVVDIPLAP